MLVELRVHEPELGVQINILVFIVRHAVLSGKYTVEEGVIYIYIYSHILLTK